MNDCTPHTCIAVRALRKRRRAPTKHTAPMTAVAANSRHTMSKLAPLSLMGTTPLPSYAACPDRTAPRDVVLWAAGGAPAGAAPKGRLNFLSAHLAGCTL
jgi:hypothetical protein